MSRVAGIAAAVVVGSFVLLLVPFLWVASEPAGGLPVLISLEGLDLGVENEHLADRRLDREQAANVYYITCASVWSGRRPRAAVIAVATALQESSLRNVPHGDAAGPSSRGLFQQMIEYYGENVAMDPMLATQAFIKRLLAVPGWEAMPLTVAAQTVQRSAHPDAYADEEPAAQRIVDLLWEPIVKLGPAACRASRVGGYALPVDGGWFQAHPEWRVAPHHDYPASDIPLPTGNPVYAVAGGTVTAAPVGGDCGEGVQILGDDGLFYTYCHGTRPLVPRGVRVPAGQPIMVSGYSGHVSPPGPAGAHLHLQINRGPGGPLLCPQPALVAWSQGMVFDPRVLPTDGCIS